MESSDSTDSFDSNHIYSGPLSSMGHANKRQKMAALIKTNVSRVRANSCYLRQTLGECISNETKWTDSHKDSLPN